MAYIGTSPSNGVRRRFVYEATASQTSFSGNDENGITLTYVDSLYLDVFQNGVKLKAGDDYTATTGTTVVLAVGASANDVVEMVAFDVFSVNDSVSAKDGGNFAGNIGMGGTLAVTGNADLNGTLNVQGETTLQTHLNMGDSDIIKLGASADLQLFHDASNSYVKDAGTGSLIIEGANVQIQDTQQDLLAKFNNAGAVQLYHVDSGTSNVKLATSGTGVTVTGVLSVTTSVSSNNTGKVWANLNGSSFGLRDSFNVSSASDQGTGTYNFNYSTNLANANYSIEMGNSFSGTGAWACFDSSGQQPTTSLWNMRIVNRNGGAQDSAFCFFAIHGD